MLVLYGRDVQEESMVSSVGEGLKLKETRKVNFLLTSFIAIE